MFSYHSVKGCIILFAALIYYTLGNIHPNYRSRIMCIQLLAVVKSSVLQEHGPDTILEPFLEDIRALESVSHNLFCLGQPLPSCA